MENQYGDDEDSVEWLLNILRQVQLEQFYVRIRDHLQISRISHFEYVTPDDLEKVITVKPPIRNMQDTLRICTQKQNKPLIWNTFAADQNFCYINYLQFRIF